jgi:hypothetical protein
MADKESTSLTVEQRYKVIEEAVRAELLFGPSAESEEEYDPKALQIYYFYLNETKTGALYEGETAGLIHFGNTFNEDHIRHINKQVALSLANHFYYGNPDDKKGLADLIKEFSKEVYENWKAHIYEELGYIVDLDQKAAVEKLEKYRAEHKTK